jgi:hypothetical protein
MNARMVVFSFAAIVAAGALILMSWVVLALLGY